MANVSLVPLRPFPRARARFVWFPHAGGSAAAFFEASAGLPADVEVLAYEYPGRGRRRSEPLPQDFAALVIEAADMLRTLGDRPLFVFGHSMGSAVAFDACRLLASRAARLPTMMFASAGRPPHISTQRERLHDLPDAGLIRGLAARGGIPDELLREHDLLQLLLPTLRQDLRLAERHLIYPVRLPMRLAIYGGAGDCSLPLGLLERWKELGDCATVRLFPGGHFYFEEQRGEFGAAIARDIEAALEARQAVG